MQTLVLISSKFCGRVHLKIIFWNFLLLVVSLPHANLTASILKGDVFNLQKGRGIDAVRWFRGCMMDDFLDILR